MSEKKTITAIATPPGDGGVGIIRISGPEAVEVANKIIQMDLTHKESHRVYLTKALGSCGEILDEVLVFKMLSPRSFTGEDVVEIQCHGGQLICKKILQAAHIAGARLALPGEFTLKAFMNGKIDLAKAESIQMMIHAKNDAALKAAKNQLEGLLSKKILFFQEELFYLAAILEASVDYPEEGLEFISTEEYLIKLKTIIDSLTKLKNTFYTGSTLNTSTKLCLIGAPNVGKSSLLNALMEKERAIVTPIAGTTRDLIEGEILLYGHHFTLIDTAGIRDTDESIEKEGIRRSLEAIERSDLILFLLDGSRPSTDFENLLFSEMDPQKTIVVTNKADLLDPSQKHQGVLISAKNLTGLDVLKELLVKWIENQNGLLSKEEVILVKERHFKAIEEAVAFLKTVQEGLENGVGGELLVMDIKSAIYSLSEIIGRNVSEEVLNQIFSNFCVGK
jgi:tRNA modification GTPase